jgi:hypothetical protein
VSLVSSDRYQSPGMVLVECVYFKDTGKRYTDAQGEFPESWFEGCIYPRDYGRRLRELGKLPGLISGRWEGPFTIEVYDKYTELVIDGQ